jgi:hypothetical protein
MDIKKELLKGHSRALTDRIVNYVDSDQSRFNTLIAIFLAGPYQITQRAAWPLSCCVENYPFLIDSHYGHVLKILNQPGIHDAVKRNIMRLLQFVDVPQKYQGKVIEHCYNLMSPTEPIAVRVFAMTVLANLAKQHTDLKKELKLVIEDQVPFATAAYLSRSKKILKQLEK